jgi:hypothetical protein
MKVNPARGCPTPRDGVDGKRSPEGESAGVSSERRAWMPEANVRRGGVGSLEPGKTPIDPQKVQAR